MVLRVTAVGVVDDHVLRVTFNDGVVREVDMAPYMCGELGEPLRDPAFFRRVRVDADSRTITWPHSLDLDPDVLHGDFPPVAAPRSRDQPIGFWEAIG